MTSVLLTRFGSIPGMGTFGKLVTDGFSCFTVEREWKQNQPEISSIPLGQYTCEIVDSPKFGKVYEVKSVPGRSHILIHNANLAEQLEGCIAVGDSLGTVGGKWAVLNSKATLSAFMAATEGEELLLIVERQV